MSVDDSLLCENPIALTNAINEWPRCCTRLLLFHGWRFVHEEARFHGIRLFINMLEHRSESGV